jgi:O6-methylguanine-DNA--protein-cysteine methyltransferase
VAAVALGGCASLTPGQERAVGEIRAMADETARVYGVSRIAVMANRNIEGVGGSYRQGLFTVSTPMLTSRHRDSIVAHELAHYLLEHDRPLAGTLAPEWKREQELRELAANAKAVEILVRVWRLPEERALSLVYDHLTSFSRLVAERRTVIPWGHRAPCEEIADLLGRFPAHRAWTDGLRCGDAGGPRAATAVPAALPLPAADAGSAGLVVHSYVTDRVPAAPGPGDPAPLPRALHAFDRSLDTHVTLLLGVRPRGRPLRVLSRWYDETGAERRVVRRAVEAPAGGETGWTWHAHTVPMWELRPYPGRWKAQVAVDDVAAGEVTFHLAR